MDAQALSALVECLQSDGPCKALQAASIYCVGGAVRDALLQRKVNDRDWLVVGSSPQQMLQAGFLPVGRDFPVFLHPISHEEFALARTERKIAKGYHGFEFYCDPAISLEEDLKRRDLRINAMAVDARAVLHDPYGGLADLQARQLRHVSDAFREDPIRLLRVARFAARLADFRIHPETQLLMRDMVRAGETDHWTAERVWRELDQGMAEIKPSALWRILSDCGLSPFQRLSTDEHKRLGQLDQAAQAGLEGRLQWGLWSVLVSEPMREEILAGLRTPQDVQAIIGLLRKHQSDLLALLSDAKGSEATELASLFESLDLLRRPQRLDDMLAVLRWHPALHAGLQAQAALVAQAIRQLADLFRQAKARDPVPAPEGQKLAHGSAIGQAMRQARELALATALRTRYPHGLGVAPQPLNDASDESICP